MPMYQQPVGTTFGWFSKNNNLNPTEADYIANGKFCSTGMAFNSNLNEATCTIGTYVSFNGRNLSEPYPCDPSDPTKKCRIYFNTLNSTQSWLSLGTRAYVQADCKCSMENTSLPGTSPGYCGSVLGLEPYTRFVAQKAFVLSTINGTQIHGLDRDNLRALRDPKALHQGQKATTGSETWRLLVDLQFNVTYWPYVQT